MSTRKLTRAMLLLNFTCYLLGLYAFFIAFDGAETVDLLTWSAIALAGSFAGATWVTRQHGGLASARPDSEVVDPESLGVKALLLLPLVLLCFEVFAIFQLNAAQYQVSWIDIAFACSLGHSLEALARRD